jgi:hypothetical protein
MIKTEDVVTCCTRMLDMCPRFKKYNLISLVYVQGLKGIFLPKCFCVDDNAISGSCAKCEVTFYSGTRRVVAPQIVRTWRWYFPALFSF